MGIGSKAKDGSGEFDQELQRVELRGFKENSLTTDAAVRRGIGDRRLRSRFRPPPEGGVRDKLHYQGWPHRQWVVRGGDRMMGCAGGLSVLKGSRARREFLDYRQGLEDHDVSDP